MGDYYKDRNQSYSRHNYQDDAGRKKSPPPVDTSAEIFYYKKQIDSHTLMTLVLQDGEQITGTIEWYDREALKINRTDAPNLLLLKHNIKYMFKADDVKDSSTAKKPAKTAK
jgi:sRNA-binding regulator protein Hfq